MALILHQGYNNWLLAVNGSHGTQNVLDTHVQLQLQCIQTYFIKLTKHRVFLLVYVQSFQTKAYKCTFEGYINNSLHLERKCASQDTCLQTLSVPRREQFSESVTRKKLHSFTHRSFFFVCFLPYSRHGWYVPLTYITETSLGSIRTVWMNKSSGIDLNNSAKPLFFSKEITQLRPVDQLTRNRCFFNVYAHNEQFSSQLVLLFQKSPRELQNLSLTMSLICMKLNLDAELI